MQGSLSRPTVALLVPADWEEMHATQAYSLDLLEPLKRAFAEAGYYLDLCRLSESGNVQDIEEFEAYISAQQPVGFIVGRVLEQDPLIDLLRQQRIPFVLYGHNSQSDDLDWIDIDNVSAFWLSTRKCIDAGHRRIALLNGPEPYSYARQRELGYSKALKQAGLASESGLILNGQPTFAMGSVMATYLMRSKVVPTALVCATDELALGAVSACMDLGLEVGKDVSIVGYGDTLAAKQTQPRLATLSYSFSVVVKFLAARLLHKLAPNAYPGIDNRRLVPVRWVDGDSLKPLDTTDTAPVKSSESRLNPAQLRDEIATRNRTQQIVHAGSWRFNPLLQEFSGSPEFNAIFGAPRNQQLSLPQLRKLLDPNSASRFDAAWFNAGRGRGLDIEIQANVGGVARFLQWRGEFVCNHGVLVYAEGAVQDVTDLVQVRQELEKSYREAEVASRAKDQFLANMSHEIRTPIHAVMGLTEVLKRQLEEGSAAKQTADKISKASGSLLNIINDILLISKVESGSLELEQYPFDLQNLVDEIAASAEGLLGNKPVQFTAAPIGPSFRYLVGDPERLKQVLLNLVGNACKFTSRGTVRLNIMRAPASHAGLQAPLLFEVVDSGIGISSSRIRELFDPFSQADSSTSRLYGGTGLGLSIARSLVQLMGGEISVESEEGAGSCFSFELNFQLGTTNTVLLNEADQLKVAIVDDSATSAIYSAEVVRQLGWLPTMFQSGQAVIDEIESDPSRYDLILLDYRMPGMSGYEVARELRAVKGAENLALVMLSAEDLSTLSEPIWSYVDQTLTKPLTSDALLGALSTLEQPTGVQQTEPPGQPCRLDGLSLLAVDDSEINLELLADMLGNLGAQVHCVRSGEQALELFQSTETAVYDLVLCDLQMPQMDGFEFTRKLHGIAGYETLPVVAVSASVDILSKQLAVDAGMHAYLQKPFGPLELAELVERVMAESENRASVPGTPVISHSVSELVNSGVSEPELFSFESGRKYWSRPDTYAQQLRAFSERYSLVDCLSDFVTEQDYDAALDYSHKLKGITAVLGLEALSDSAKKLETLLRKPATEALESDALALAAQLAQIHRQTLDTLGLWLADQAQIQLSAPLSGSEQVSISVGELRKALQSFDPVASEKCLVVDIDGIPESLLRDIRHAVSVFDFKSALKLLETVQPEPGVSTSRT